MRYFRFIILLSKGINMEMTWNVFRFDRALTDNEQRKLTTWCIKQFTHPNTSHHITNDTQFTVGWIPADTCDELVARIVCKLPDVTFRLASDWGSGDPGVTYHGADPLGMEIADLYEQIGDLQDRVQALRTAQANRNAAKGA